MKKGHLIVLNGGSSVGKTSAIRALQDEFDDLWVRLGLDRFWLAAIPPNQMDIHRVDPIYFSTKSFMKNDLEYFHVTPGPFLDRNTYASYKAIAAYLDSGINVVSDQIFWKPEWFRKALDSWSGYHVFFVGIHVSDEEGARRENERAEEGVTDTEAGGRAKGWGRCSAEVTHKNMIYDFEIDTTNLSIEETSKKIKEAYKKQQHPTAFKKLYKTFE